jgi:hypothetical protein
VVLICLDFSPQLVQITINLQEPSVEIRLAGACSSHLLYAHRCWSSIRNLHREHSSKMPIHSDLEQNPKSFYFRPEHRTSSAHHVSSQFVLQSRVPSSTSHFRTRGLNHPRVHLQNDTFASLHCLGIASTITAQGCNDQRKLNPSSLLCSESSFCGRSNL